jgi:hypothetical protein
VLLKVMPVFHREAVWVVLVAEQAVLLKTAAMALLGSWAVVVAAVVGRAMVTQAVQAGGVVMGSW